MLAHRRGRKPGVELLGVVRLKLCGAQLGELVGAAGEDEVRLHHVAVGLTRAGRDGVAGVLPVKSAKVLGHRAIGGLEVSAGLTPSHAQKSMPWGSARAAQLLPPGA
jgi:hypothetical protein